MRATTLVATILVAIAAGLIFIGITNNQDGPVWLGILLISFVGFTGLYIAFENLVLAKKERPDFIYIKHNSTDD